VAKKQKPARNHHYVPKCLLRRFENADGKLWVYDLKKGEIHPCRPKAVGFSKDLYRVTGKHGHPDYDGLEKCIAANIDGPGDNAISTILQGGRRNEEWIVFLRFVAAQMARTPGFFERISDMSRPLFGESLKRLAKHHPLFRERVLARGVAKGQSSAEIEAVLDSIARGEWSAKPSNEATLKMALKQIETFQNELQRMKWQILQPEASGSDFILGDQPVLVIVPAGERVTLKHPKVNVVLPLNTRNIAVGRWIDGIPLIEVNRETMRRAQRYMFSSIHSDEMLAEARTLFGTGPKVRTIQIKDGERLTTIIEYR